MPLWAHSCKEIFFRNHNGDLVAAEISTTPSFSVQSQKSLFSLGSF